MAASGKSGWIGGLAALLQQWQVVVTGIAAATALWFGFADQRRKQVEINRDAVTAAKALPADAFALDPYATLAEFRVSYPEHAFCAALGTFLAEAARQGFTADVSTARRMNDAVGAQIDRIAAEGALSLATIEDLAVVAAGDGTGADSCPALRPPVGLRGLAMWPDCRVLIETFAQTRCQSVALDVRRAAVAAQAMAGAAASPPSDEPAPAPPPGATPGPDLAAERMAPPDPACGPSPPTVFVQFTGDPDGAEAVRDRLAAAGWTAAPVEEVVGVRPVGDVRYYWPDQASCAEALAASLGAALATSFTAISLAGRYRNLARDRMEIWLPSRY